MKSDTRRIVARRGQSDSLGQKRVSSRSSKSVPISKTSTRRQDVLRVQKNALPTLKTAAPVQYLSKSTEKIFRRMKDKPSARRAYVEAEVVTHLAHQIRAIRCQRGWSQLDLAAHLKTTQATISRLENPSYGRVTLSTLFALSSAFDTGLRVEFVSLITMLSETFAPSVDRREVSAFEDEAGNVMFYEVKGPRYNQSALLPKTSSVFLASSVHLDSSSSVSSIVELNNIYGELDAHVAR